ncbi:MAG: aldose 1-epimerase [Candidatus Tectomicrobia bacterium]|nr:aldose 1-epimerase [Candidatus Tectomicrobia bacterium]
MPQRYSIRSEMRSQMEIFSLHEGDKAYAEVAPGAGNNCFLFRVQEPILEPVHFEEFRQRPTSYGNPILFPFPNRIRDGTFSFRGKPYVVNPPRHGFVRDKRWNVLGTGASDQEGAWIRSGLEATQYREEILKQFPFPFRIEVTYRLKESALEMETVAQNRGEEVMPLGFGIHSYFRRPEKGTIQVPAQKWWELIDALPTGNLLNVEGQYDLRQPSDVTRVVLDDIFTDLIPDSDGLVRCLLNDQQRGMQTVVEFDAKQFPHVVIFTPPAPRQAICIEPYTCPTDAFNLYDRRIESNVILLPPKESVSFRVRIYERVSTQ